MLLIFLPPLLYAAAFFSNLRELRRIEYDLDLEEARLSPEGG